MLRYFPNIYPDELLYNAYSRYYRNTGKCSIKSTFTEIFGLHNHVFQVVDFPRNLDAFISQIETEDFYNSDDIIFRFTMLPLFYPFLNESMQAYCINAMKGNQSKVIYIKLGILASNITYSRSFKYCPDCIYEDIERYGEPYFHRSHNLEGVLLCHKHRKILQTNCPICNVIIAPKDKYKLIPLESKCCNGHELFNEFTDFDNVNISSSDFKFHLLVANLVYHILNMDFRALDINIEQIKMKYLCKLQKMNLLTAKGLIGQTELKEYFINYFGHSFLKAIKSDIDPNSSYCWIKELLQKKYRTTHPIKHILLLIFLCNKNENEILNLITSNTLNTLNVFGCPPWPCLNPVADHYLKNVVYNCTISTCPDTKKPVGIFKCICGFTYTKNSSDKFDNNSYSLQRIMAFGHVWEEKLTNIILKEGGTLRSIAKRMSCDPKTVRKYAIKLGLPFCWQCKNNNPTIINKTSSKKLKYDTIAQCNQYAKNLTNYLKLQTEPVSIKQVRNLFEREYTYLYRHNKELLSIILVPCSNYLKKKSNSIKVDWEQRDTLFYSLVSDKIEHLMVSEKLCRITINKIERDLGIYPILSRNLNRLPLTNSLVSSSIETIEDYQIRRINYVANKMRLNNETITEWKLYRKAGIKKSCTDRIKYEISNLLQ